jgi:hypothetical protein
MKLWINKLPLLIKYLNPAQLNSIELKLRYLLMTVGCLVEYSSLRAISTKSSQNAIGRKILNY